MKYIGTRIINAEKCRAWQSVGNHILGDEGYKIELNDYTLWSPKDVFEKYYHCMDGLPFGFAIEAVKNGFKAQRKGWNGKNQYIELATNVSYINHDGETMNVNHEQMGNKSIAFVGTSGTQLGWLASQADMLSEDWIILKD